MVKVYYKSTNTFTFKKTLKALGVLLVAGGVFLSLYSFFPVLSWQIYFAPSFESQKIETPIPKTIVLDASQIQSLIRESKNNIILDYTNASNWYPTFQTKGKKRELDYTLSIPKLGLSDILVSTKDNDLTKHLVNYEGTAVPPDKGNAVIFGHSTLPQLFNRNDYKTIFANAYKLSVGDDIFVHLDKVTYKYKIFQITIVDPEDTSVLAQNYDNEVLTLITCTPPGTVWKRLIIKSGLEKI